MFLSLITSPEWAFLLASLFTSAKLELLWKTGGTAARQVDMLGPGSWPREELPQGAAQGRCLISFAPGAPQP